MTGKRGNGSALPQAWLEVGASTAPSWLPGLVAPLLSTEAPAALTRQRVAGTERSVCALETRAGASPRTCVAL